MTTSVTWPTGVIFVPKADTVFVGIDPVTGRELRTFDTVAFHIELRILEESVDGRAFPVTHNYNSAVVLAGLPYAPQLDINGVYYTIEFEDGTYRVTLTGSNNNIIDVAIVNGVQIVPTNSAGSTSPGYTPTDKFRDDEVYKRLDLDQTVPVTHWKDSSRIALNHNVGDDSADIDIVSTDNGNGTFTTQRQP